jgi:hypothetical protein
MQALTDFVGTAEQIQGYYDRLSQGIEQFNKIRRLWKSQAKIIVANYLKNASAIDFAYRSTGFSECPSRSRLAAGEQMAFKFRTRTSRFSKKGYVIYELRNDLDYSTHNRPREQRVFLIAGASCGTFRKNRMMLEIIYADASINLTSEELPQQLYDMLKLEFCRPGARLRRAGRIDKFGFSVTAQMNESTPAVMVVEMDQWDYYDTDDNVIVLHRYVVFVKIIAMPVSNRANCDPHLEMKMEKLSQAVT